MNRILIVDDEAHIREVVRFALARAGYHVTEAGTGEQALALLGSDAFDLVVLDVVMPGIDGTEVCRRLRAKNELPVVFLTSRDEELDRILGLELGGDDYVTKPFSPRELVARIRAVLRRARPAPAAPSDELSVGPLRIDRARFRVSWDGVDVSLTVTEFGILATLTAAPGRVYSRGQLMERVWGDGVVVSDRTVDSHVKRLRKKFEVFGASPIETVHGLGYRLNEQL